jgi:anti-sigma factor RsiW
VSDLPGDAHRELRERLGLYALGRGDAAERAVVRAHLDGCAACRAELAELTPLASRLSDVDPDRLEDVPGPPPELGAAVLARIAAEQAGTTDLAAHRRRRTRLAAAVAATGIAAAAFAVGWLVRPVPPEPPLEPVAVQVTEQGLTATADLVPHTWGVEVKLSGEGFVAGEIYRVVVRDDEGKAAPAGEFVGVGAAHLDCNLNSAVLREDATGFEVVDEEGAVVLRSTF